MLHPLLYWFVLQAFVMASGMFLNSIASLNLHTGFYFNPFATVFFPSCYLIFYLNGFGLLFD